MKKFKLLFTAIGVFAVVGSALAVGSFSNRNLRVCSNKVNPPAGVCIAQPVAKNYSSIRPSPNAQPIVPDEKVYLGTLGAQCTSAACPEFIDPVYDNQ